MRLNRTILIAGMLLLATGLWGQAEFPTFISRTMYNIDKLATEVHYNNSLNNGEYIAGTPYQGKDFRPGVFYLKGFDPVASDTRLNLFENRFEYTKGEQLYYADPEVLDSVRYEGKVYVYRDMEYDGLIKNRLAELVARSGQNELCRLTVVAFLPEVKAGGYIDPKPARFEWYEPVYVLVVNEQVITLSNLSKLYSAFPSHKDEIKKFIRSQKVKKNQADGLTRLLHYLAQI
ncbi:MAG TPA: hypothetical protein PLK12_14920 [Prolixibacteraceae bacterium]|nr:hypothetical protein [Prolixibacteraceae bacterium]